MPTKEKCNKCKGEGSLVILVNYHDDDIYETIICYNCLGTGIINKMSKEEEDDYNFSNDWN